MTSGFQGTQENFDLIKPRLDEMASGEVRKFNLSVPTSVALSMRVWRSYKEDLARFVAAFKPEAFNPASYEDFSVRIGALWWADAVHNQTVDPTSGVQEALERAKPLHRKLSKAAGYLWDDDEEIGPVVASIRAGQGYADRADDLVRYAALFIENWAAAQGKCDVTKEDLEEAREVGARLLDAMTSVPAGDVAEIRDRRDRAGEYLRRAVDDIRDAAAYVFRKDPESMERYPSLYSGRRSTTKPGPKPETTVPEQYPDEK